MAEAIKALGEKTALQFLNAGEKNAAYRKKYNMYKNAVFEKVKTDPRFKDLREQTTKQQLGTK
jgi:hypothetical protein